MFGKFPVHAGRWCTMCGGVEVWYKNILNRFIEGQTHFGMPSGAKMILILNEPHKIGCSSFNSTTTSRHATQVERNYWYCIQNNQWKIIDDQLPTRSTVELKDNSNVVYQQKTLKTLLYREHDQGPVYTLTAMASPVGKPQIANYLKILLNTQNTFTLNSQFSTGSATIEYLHTQIVPRLIIRLIKICQTP